MIAIGSDHGGFELKKEVMAHLDARGLEYKDFGTYSDASCDYPVYGKAVAKAVASGECERGIIICGTGIGISITPRTRCTASARRSAETASPPRRPVSTTTPMSSRSARASSARALRLRSLTPSSTHRFPTASGTSAA